MCEIMVVYRLSLGIIKTYLKVTNNYLMCTQPMLAELEHIFRIVDIKGIRLANWNYWILNVWKYYLHKFCNIDL